MVVKQGAKRQGLYLHEVELKEKLEDMFKTANGSISPALEKREEENKTPSKGSTPAASKLIIAKKWEKNKKQEEQKENRR